MKATTYDFAKIGDRMREARRVLKLNQIDFHDKYVGPDHSTLRTFQRAEKGTNEAGMSLIEAFVRAGINANWLLTGEGPMLTADLMERPASNIRAGIASLESEMLDEQRLIQLMAQRVSVRTGPAPGNNSPDSEHEGKRDEYVAIPLYNGVRAAAGGGALIEHETPDDVLMFKEQWVRIELGAHPQDLYLIRVAGDSMEPTLRSGDVILVDRRATRPDREGVYILRMNDMLLVKRLQALPGGVVRVISDNAAFASFDVPIADVGGPDLVIIGRVVWTGRRM